MIYWIKRIARIVAFCSFFVIFFSGINPEDPFDSTVAVMAFLKAFCGAVLLWVSGFIISDIILKGAIEDIRHDDIEVLEGGIIQRIHTTQREPRVIDKAECQDGSSVEQAKTKRNEKEEKKREQSG